MSYHIKQSFVSIEEFYEVCLKIEGLIHKGEVNGQLHTFIFCGLFLCSNDAPMFFVA